MQEVYDRFFTLAMTIAEEKDDILLVAGIMLAQAMRLYKTMLGEQDFLDLCETVYETSKEIKPLDLETYDLSKTFH
jgi:hypothetical protein